MRIRRLFIILTFAIIFFAAESERGFYADGQFQLSNITNSAANLNTCLSISKSAKIKPLNFLESFLLVAPAYSQEKSSSDYPGFHTGYSVQVVTVNDESSALEIERFFQDILKTEAIVKYENHHWKVCAGKFDERESADKFCEKVRLEGYPEAFVIGRPIPTIVQGFRIQLSSFSTKSAAEAYASKISCEITAEVHVIRDGNFWKVRAGDFTDRQKAEEFRDTSIKKGFKDAWITADTIETN